jgi:biopolymer transport protein ExbB
MKNVFSVSAMIAFMLIVVAASVPTVSAAGAEVNEPATAGIAEANLPTGDPNVTAGEADAAGQEIETEFEKWVRKLRDAGAVIPVLLVLSVVGVALILERFWAMRRSNFAPQRLFDQVNRLWDKGQFDKIQNLCRGKSNTLAAVVAFVVEHRDKPASTVSSAAADLAARDLKRHLLRAYPLAVIATVSPLLGLLGTVSGMVGAFDTVAMMGELGDAGALGGDISKALVTTLVGLVVAIPTLFAYHYFKGRTQYFGIILEEQLNILVTERLMKKEAGDGN